MHTEAKAGAGVLNNLKDAPMAGTIFRITLAPTNINITHMTSNQNSMVHHVVCVEDSIIPPKHCYKGEHDINNIMEKMSINPHQSQQNNLYQ